MLNKITFTKPNGAKTYNPSNYQIDCRTVNCKRKGYWVERDTDGTLLFCFRTRHDGENHAVKLSIGEIEEEIRRADI